MTGCAVGHLGKGGLCTAISQPPVEDAMYVLEARELRKSFGEGEAAVEALRGLNLGAKAGEMLAIMGAPDQAKARC